MITITIMVIMEIMVIMVIVVIMVIIILTMIIIILTIIITMINKITLIILTEVGIWISGIELINVIPENFGTRIFGIYIYNLNSRNPNPQL